MQLALRTAGFDGLHFRYSWLLIAVLSCAALPALGSDPRPFATDAKFSFDDDDASVQKELQHRRFSLSSAVATIEPPSGPMKYRWVEINFYSFLFTREDVAAAASGDKEAIHRKWEAMGANSNPFTEEDWAAARKGNREALDRKSKAMLKKAEEFNRGWASIQLAVDEKFRVRTVNVSVPGCTCTIAILEQDLKTFLQEYQFDGKKLRLKSKGSHVCDMKSAGFGTPKFEWDIDLTTPVFAQATPGK